MYHNVKTQNVYNQSLYYVHNIKDKECLQNKPLITNILHVYIHNKYMYVLSAQSVNLYAWVVIYNTVHNSCSTQTCTFKLITVLMVDKRNMSK